MVAGGAVVDGVVGAGAADAAAAWDAWLSRSTLLSQILWSLYAIHASIGLTTYVTGILTVTKIRGLIYRMEV